MLFVVFTNQRQNIVDIDLYLLDKLHLEDHIFVDLLRLVFLRPEFVVEVDIRTVVILYVAFGQNLASGKGVERRKNIPQLQNRTV